MRFVIFLLTLTQLGLGQSGFKTSILETRLQVRQYSSLQKRYQDCPTTLTPMSQVRFARASGWVR